MSEPFLWFLTFLRILSFVVRLWWFGPLLLPTSISHLSTVIYRATLFLHLSSLLLLSSFCQHRPHLDGRFVPTSRVFFAPHRSTSPTLSHTSSTLNLCMLIYIFHSASTNFSPQNIFSTAHVFFKTMTLGRGSSAGHRIFWLWKYFGIIHSQSLAQTHFHVHTRSVSHASLYKHYHTFLKTLLHFTWFNLKKIFQCFWSL